MGGLISSRLAAMGHGMRGGGDIVWNPGLPPDPVCMALYRFEPGALERDTKGGVNLSNNAVTVDTANKRERRASALFNSTDQMSIADGDLVAGFPWKNGGGVASGSITHWYRPTSLPAMGNARYIVGKFDATNGKNTITTYIRNNAGTHVAGARVCFNGTGWSTHDVAGVTPVVGHWYHFGVALNDDIELRIRIWDETAATVYERVEDTTGLYPIYIGTGGWRIGGLNSWDQLAGNVDEVSVHAGVLSAAQIDLIRQGKYKY